MRSALFAFWSLKMWMPCSVRELTGAEVALAKSSMSSHALAKAAETGSIPKYKLVGIASAENPDLEGDEIEQAGVDWKPFLKRGFINDDHGRGASAVIGYPTKVYKTRVKVDGKSYAATGVEAVLFDLPKAAELARLAMAMDGTTRQMGLSVEGPPPVRAPNNRARITNATVNHLALTAWPVNPATTASVELVKSFARLAKSMAAGYPGDSGAGSMRPVMPESLGTGRLPRMDLDIDALRALSDGWAPTNLTIDEAAARRLIRAMKPTAAPYEVTRLLEMAR